MNTVACAVRSVLQSKQNLSENGSVRKVLKEKNHKYNSLVKNIYGSMQPSPYN